MRVILFGKCENITSKLGSVLKEKYSSVKVYTDLLHFLESIFDNDDNAIFIVSENILKTRDIKISYILKRFDYCKPILTYSINSNICLNLDINYIYEYQKDNYQVFMEDIYNIKSCFNKFVDDKDYFLSYNLNVREMPIYLSANKKNNTSHNLYGINNLEENSDIISSLTKMQAKLFMLLLSHTEGMSLKDILYNLWGSDDKTKAQNVYTLVHKLSHIISQKTSNKFRIIHQRKKYHLIQNKDTSTNLNPNNTSITRNIDGYSTAE